MITKRNKVKPKLTLNTTIVKNLKPTCKHSPNLLIDTKEDTYNSKRNILNVLERKTYDVPIKILPNLYLGSCDATQNLEQLLDKNITTILNLAPEVEKPKWFTNDHWIKLSNQHYVTKITKEQLDQTTSSLNHALVKESYRQAVQKYAIPPTPPLSEDDEETAHLKESMAMTMTMTNPTTTTTTTSPLPISATTTTNTTTTMTKTIKTLAGKNSSCCRRSNYPHSPISHAHDNGHQSDNDTLKDGLFSEPDSSFDSSFIMDSPENSITSPLRLNSKSNTTTNYLTLPSLHEESEEKSMNLSHSSLSLLLPSSYSPASSTSSSQQTLVFSPTTTSSSSSPSSSSSSTTTTTSSIRLHTQSQKLTASLVDAMTPLSQQHQTPSSSSSSSSSFNDGLSSPLPPETSFMDTFSAFPPETPYMDSYSALPPETPYMDTFSALPPETPYMDTFSSLPPETPYADAFTVLSPQTPYMDTLSSSPPLPSLSQGPTFMESEEEEEQQQSQSQEQELSELSHPQPKQRNSITFIQQQAYTSSPLINNLKLTSSSTPPMSILTHSMVNFYRKESNRNSLNRSFTNTTTTTTTMNNNNSLNRKLKEEDEDQISPVTANNMASSKGRMPAIEIHYHHNTWEHNQKNTHEKLIQAFDIIDSTRLVDQQSILVSCQQGVSRSATLVIAYVMKTKNWGLMKSYDFVKEKCPWIAPNITLMNELTVFEQFLIHENTTKQVMTTTTLGGSNSRVNLPFTDLSSTTSSSSKSIEIPSR